MNNQMYVIKIFDEIAPGKITKTIFTTGDTVFQKINELDAASNIKYAVYSVGECLLDKS